jgi:DNA/RNA-binding domain of Phe-tRNA-synthetase-like protein
MPALTSDDIDKMSISAMQNMLKQMGKDPQGMTEAQMRAMLKRMLADNTQANQFIRRMAGR